MHSLNVMRLLNIIRDQDIFETEVKALVQADSKKPYRKVPGYSQLVKKFVQDIKPLRTFWKRQRL